MKIQKAERRNKKCKMLLNGASGSGKTYSALALASGLGSKILVADTENGSSELYADDFEFDVVTLSDFQPSTYLAVMKEAEKRGYDVLIIDSLSHAWQHLLEEVDRIQKRERGKNSFTAWADVTPIYNQMVAGIVACGIHVIACTRAKSEYIMEEYTDKYGKTKTKPVKIGLAPIFRQGGEFEFDVVANIDLDHNFMVEKTRYKFLDGAVIQKVGKDKGKEIADWLSSGKAAEPKPVEPPTIPKIEPITAVAKTPIVQEPNYWYEFSTLNFDAKKLAIAEQLALKQHAYSVEENGRKLWAATNYLEPRKNFDQFLIEG